MWMPCNFGEKIRLREHIGYPFKEYRLVGLSIGLYNGGYNYTFQEVRSEKLTYIKVDLWVDLKDKISFWGQAFNNPDFYDEESLNSGEIDLKIYPGSGYIKYNRYFQDSKSSAEGECLSIMITLDGKYLYTFRGHDAFHKSFIVDDLFANTQFMAYADDLILL